MARYKQVIGHTVPHVESLWGHPLVTVTRDEEWPKDPGALIEVHEDAPLRMDPLAAALMTATILDASDPSGRYIVLDTRPEKKRRWWRR